MEIRTWAEAMILIKNIIEENELLREKVKQYEQPPEVE